MLSNGVTEPITLAPTTRQLMTTKECRPGTVFSVGEGEVTVSIEQRSACSGCHAREFCCSADCAERHIVIKTDDSSYKAGDAVVVEGDNRIGRLAVLLSFVIPIILVVTSVAVSTLILAMSEALSCLVALVVLGGYLVALRLMTPRLRRIMRFSITQNTQDKITINV